MEIVGIIIAIVVLAIVAFLVWRRVAAERAAEKARLAQEASAHREQADSNVARARELGSAAEVHRAEAERHAVAADEHAHAAQEHAEKASELESKIRTAGKSAARHDELATDREQKLA